MPTTISSTLFLIYHLVFIICSSFITNFDSTLRVHAVTSLPIIHRLKIKRFMISRPFSMIEAHSMMT